MTVRKIIYYVAASIDGYIMNSEETIEKFVGDGSGIKQYLNDLKNFDTVIIERKTYEFGCKFGLQPGQVP